MSRLLPFALLCCFAFGCGTVEAPQACQTTCDCTRTDAPESCPGEWVCNADKVCAYACKGGCADLPYTCRSEEECNGTLCSEHHKSCR